MHEAIFYRIGLPVGCKRNAIRYNVNIRHVRLEKFVALLGPEVVQTQKVDDVRGELEGESSIVLIQHREHFTKHAAEVFLTPERDRR